MQGFVGDTAAVKAAVEKTSQLSCQGCVIGAYVVPQVREKVKGSNRPGLHLHTHPCAASAVHGHARGDPAHRGNRPSSTTSRKA
eukprot:40575-Eustigmatos_ZCMA.PRE.1